MNCIDEQILIRDYASIWHPHRYRREKARRKLGQALEAADFLKIRDVVNHYRIHCLEELYNDYLKSLRFGMESPESTVEQLIEAHTILLEICGELGVESPITKADILAFKQSRRVAGTLYAYM
jgi:hypothetical protein